RGPGRDVFPLGFGLVDLIVPGPALEQTRLRNWWDSVWPGRGSDAPHESHGWVGYVGCPGDVGWGREHPLGFWSSVSEGFSWELSVAGIPAVE
ncbi:MAG TPA: hypothetical protein VF148_04025, partial [Acidimicrobiia bacterium]